MRVFRAEKKRSGHCLVSMTITSSFCLFLLLLLLFLLRPDSFPGTFWRCEQCSMRKKEEIWSCLKQFPFYFTNGCFNNKQSNIEKWTQRKIVSVMQCTEAHHQMNFCTVALMTFCDFSFLIFSFQNDVVHAFQERSLSWWHSQIYTSQRLEGFQFF